ncbi:TetR/AcrR family transcriptional regulator [Herminiimonas fonticola]|uniref:TetR family transcriptional regulator n=1 Tax=Herminiimonas fonticola TaxID=303380 RepID=A0A4R6GIV7_9BURK|nr:TetR/AcrR family transcriptional regulator [Herminiimonas fonticola]RBA25689.1 Bacterial regulatory protein, tetR family [Herminiimonas fonticola]TDN94797.1 TetR family transcriptional regulator [Herminiimonas fonticola]
MARPRSEEKRAALLDAAIQVIAERGLSATPTSAISAVAGVAEGSLFTYFKTKDELVNALYLGLKAEMAEVLMTNFPHKAEVRRQFQYVWDNYVAWGVANQQKKRVMDQLTYSAQITPESREAGAAPFVEILQILQQNVDDKILRNYPVAFIAASMNSLAEMTMDFILQDPKGAARYRKSGFEVWWNGVANM